MAILLQINKLNYQITDDKIFNISLDVQKGDYISIIAPNKSGKTILTKLICAIIPTDNKFQVDGIILNKENVLDYLEKIGIVSNELNIFLTKKVKDELTLPLKNLGYNESKINKRLNKIVEFFQIEDILDKNPNLLDSNNQAKLQIIISLMHDPKILILDDAFNNMNNETKNFMLEKLSILNKDGLTILNITSNLDTIYDSNQVYLLNNFKLDNLGSVLETFEEDNYLRQIGLEIPFIIDLSIKLRFYGLIDKIYFNLEELEEDLWKSNS